MARAPGNGPDRSDPGYRRAWSLVIVFGVISLLSDLVYQAGRSLNGPFLAELGANAAVVGLVAGAAEFLGYGLRLVTGALVDRSRAYWAFTIGGYALVVAVPLMALAGTWQVAAVFIAIERMSKAVRAPAKDTLLSMAARRVGTGRGFALHKVLDQTGAVLGPLAMAAFLAASFSYQQAYALLVIPLVGVLVAAFWGRSRVPRPQALEAELGSGPPAPRSPVPAFGVFAVFTFLVALGFVNVTLLSYHAKAAGLLPDAAIPLWYALAMAAAGLAAWLVGHWYDRGRRVLFLVPITALPLPFLGFLGGTEALCAAFVLFGASLGVQETILKAAVADLVPLGKRGKAFGVFNTVQGVGLLASGAVLGALYEVSVWALCWFSLGASIAALVVLAWMGRRFRAIGTDPHDDRK